MAQCQRLTIIQRTTHSHIEPSESETQTLSFEKLTRFRTTRSIPQEPTPFLGSAARTHFPRPLAFALNWAVSVPEGQTTIARRFNAGFKVREG